MAPERPSARERALRHLATRPRSVAEVDAKLLAEGYPRDEVDAVVSALKEARLLDDAILAEEFLAARAPRLGRGRSRLLVELERRGIEREVAAAAWDRVVEDGRLDPGEGLAKAARRLLGSAKGRLDRREYARVYNALLRAGFDETEVASVLEAHRPAPSVRGLAERTDDDLA